MTALDPALSTEQESYWLTVMSHCLDALNAWLTRER